MSLGLEAATFGSSSVALKANCGGKSLGSPQKGKTEMAFALTTLFHAPFERGPPCMDKAAEKPVDITFGGKIDKTEAGAVCCR